MDIDKLNKKINEEINKTSRFIKYFVAFIISLLFLSIGCCTIKSCNSNYVANQPIIMPSEAVQQPPQQVIVGHDDHHGAGIGTGAILGGAAGYMLGKNSASNRRPVIVNKTYINRSYSRPYYNRSSYRSFSRRR